MKRFYRGDACIIAMAVFLGILIVGLVGLIAFGATIPLTTQETVTVKITEKERIHDGDEDKYLIWTEGEVFENTDSLVLGKFNSSDIYGKIQENETYECKVYGWRIPFLSMYRNIIDCNLKGENK